MRFLEVISKEIEGVRFFSKFFKFNAKKDYLSLESVDFHSKYYTFHLVDYNLPNFENEKDASSFALVFALIIKEYFETLNITFNLPDYYFDNLDSSTWGQYGSGYWILEFKPNSKKIEGNW